MRYRTRLVLLVTGLLASAIISYLGCLHGQHRNALLASAEDLGQIVANLLARSAGLANEIREVEEDAGRPDGGRSSNHSSFHQRRREGGLSRRRK